MVWAYGLSKITELGLEKLQDIFAKHADPVPPHIKEELESTYFFSSYKDPEKAFQGHNRLSHGYSDILKRHYIRVPSEAELIPGALIHEHAHLASGWQRKYLELLEKNPVLKALHYATRRPELLGVIGGLIPGPWGLAFTVLGYAPHFIANTEANVRGMTWLLTNKGPYKSLSKTQKHLALAHLGLQQLKTHARLAAALGLALAIKKAMEGKNGTK
jgi:hypothetical protein